MSTHIIHWMLPVFDHWDHFDHWMSFTNPGRGVQSSALPSFFTEDMGSSMGSMGYAAQVLWNSGLKPAHVFQSLGRMWSF